VSRNRYSTISAPLRSRHVTFDHLHYCAARSRVPPSRHDPSGRQWREAIRASCPKTRQSCRSRSPIKSFIRSSVLFRAPPVDLLLDRAPLHRDRPDLDRDRLPIDRDRKKIDRDRVDLMSVASDLHRDRSDLDRSEADLDRDRADLYRDRPILHRSVGEQVPDRG